MLTVHARLHALELIIALRHVMLGPSALSCEEASESIKLTISRLTARLVCECCQTCLQCSSTRRRAFCLPRLRAFCVATAQISALSITFKTNSCSFVARNVAQVPTVYKPVPGEQLRPVHDHAHHVQSPATKPLQTAP